MKNGKPKPGQGKAKRAANKKDATKDAPEAVVLEDDTLRAERRVAKLRDKLRQALDDPEKRQQMVEAIRLMMRGEE